MNQKKPQDPDILTDIFNKLDIDHNNLMKKLEDYKSKLIQNEKIPSYKEIEADTFNITFSLNSWSIAIALMPLMLALISFMESN